MQFALAKTNFSDQWFNEFSPDSEKCCRFRSQWNLQQPDLWEKNAPFYVTALYNTIFRNI